MKFDLKSEVIKAIDVVKLDRGVIKEVYDKKESNLPAMLIASIGGFLSIILSVGFMALIVGPLFAVVSIGIYTAIIFFLALIFGGKGSYEKLFNVIAYASILTWISIIPYLGWIFSLWIFVVTFVALEVNFNLTRKRALIVVSIPIIVSFIVSLAIAGLIFFITHQNTLARFVLARWGKGNIKQEEIKEYEDKRNNDIKEIGKFAEMYSENVTQEEINKIPKDIPIYKDSKIDSIFFMDGNASIRLVTSDNTKKISDFYTKSMKENGWKIDSISMLEEIDTVTISGDKEDKSLMVITQHIQDGKIEIGIALTVK
jgi:hypothetical protein